MTDETKVYDERGRDLAKDLANAFGFESGSASEDAIFKHLKVAYAEGCIDTLKARLAIAHEAG